MRRISTDAVLTVYPVSLEEIIEAIGEADTLKLVETIGGTSPRLPALRNISEDHAIAKIIGVEKLKKLVSDVGGSRYVYFPKCADGIRRKRDQEIVRRYQSGESVDRLALEYGLSDRQIWNILKKTEMEDNQTSLF
jgi:uncharacterized protein (DUF433 family)